MSKSHKKVRYSHNCSVIHGAQTNYNLAERRKRRRDIKRILRHASPDKDIIFPPDRQYANPWYSPGDGGHIVSDETRDWLIRQGIYRYDRYMAK